ncbi:MAG: hypothetical protein BGO69_13190 [Bacteroidetes bacterium 46-16]|nr:MAG: hypothetical protein BGO69_13190 [Bacteroidetes bacterium 46-16]
MDKKTISVSHKMNGLLDDDYTLFEDGTVLHEFDKHTYPGGQNLKETLAISDLSDAIKQRLIEAASEENKQLVREILGAGVD